MAKVPNYQMLRVIGSGVFGKRKATQGTCSKWRTE